MEADQRQAGGILPQDVSMRGSLALEPGIKTLLRENEDGDVGVMSSGGDCPGEAVVEEGREEGLARPVNVPAVIGQLQLLFARLQYSNRRSAMGEGWGRVGGGRGGGKGGSIGVRGREEGKGVAYG